MTAVLHTSQYFLQISQGSLWRLKKVREVSLKWTASSSGYSHSMPSAALFGTSPQRSVFTIVSFISSCIVFYPLALTVCLEWLSYGHKKADHIFVTDKAQYFVIYKYRKSCVTLYLGLYLRESTYGLNRLSDLFAPDLYQLTNQPLHLFYGLMSFLPLLYLNCSDQRVLLCT